MRTRPIGTALLLVILTVSPSSGPRLCAEEAPQGPASAAPARLVSNVFENTDIRVALAEVGLQTGVVIVPDQTVEGAVSMQLENVPLERALEMILASGGFISKKMPEGYYLVGLPKPESSTFSTFSETRTVRLNYVKADAALKMLAKGFSPYVTANPATDTLAVTAPPALLERILEDIRQADQPPRHVILDARIVAIERTDLFNLGVQWNWPRVQAGVFSSSSLHGGATAGANWPWGIQIGYTTGSEYTNSLLLTLNLLSQNDEATVIANPQVMAQDGRPAEIQVNTEEYFQIVTEGYYVNARLEKIASGTVLSIIPRIGEKGDITLEMATEVSDVVARGENNLPVVTRRTAKSTVRLEDGGTAIIAGLMDTRSRLARRRVPGAASLPLVGEPFKDKSSTRSSRQVAVFVTARLLPEPEPGVPAAETGTAVPRRGPVKAVSDGEFREALRQSLRRTNGERN